MRLKANYSSPQCDKGESRLGPRPRYFRVRSTLIPLTRDGTPPCISLSLACLRRPLPNTESKPRAWEGGGLPGLLSLRGVLAVKACARALARARESLREP